MTDTQVENRVTMEDVHVEVMKKQEEYISAAHAENIDPENDSEDMSDVDFTLKMRGIPRKDRRKFFKLASSKKAEDVKKAINLLKQYG